MKKILVIFLFPVFGFAQDYSFTSADISGALTAASLAVDNVAVDNATIGHSSDTDLLTFASGSLTVAGEILTSSDKKLKINISNLDHTLAKLVLLNPKKYTMNNDPEQKEKIGLLAQDVEKVFPEIINTSDMYLSVNYQALIPILINAVNEQTKRNENLKQRIVNLKSKINEKIMKTKFLIFFSLISLIGFSQNLTINSGATLTISKDGKLTVSGSLTNSGTLNIEQDADESGSLIAKAASTPTITLKKYLVGSQWTLIGIPVTGEVVNDIDDNLATNSGKSAIGYWDNDKAGGAGWVTFNTGSTDANELVPTRGYEIMRSSSGTVSFTGTMLNSDQTQAITTESGTNGNWNLVGNPFPSYLNMTDDSGDATNNFLTANTSALGNGAYVAVYAWDGSNYDTYNQSDGDSQDKMAPGDGFFVYASSDTNVSFTEAMQEHDGGLGFVGSVAPPSDPLNGSNNSEVLNREVYYKLKMDDQSENKHVLISFTDQSTKGLDPGYDAGVFRIGNSHIYTKLLKDDNGIGFSIQSLPYSEINNVVVPLAIDSKSSKISIDVVQNTLPNGTLVYMEDRSLKTFVEINNDYTINTNSELNGYGRFYLHFTNDIIPELPTDGDFRIFKISENEVRLMGDSDKNYIANIYDFSGRLIKTLNFDHKVDVSNLKKGIHVLKLSSEGVITTKKFVVE